MATARTGCGTPHFRPLFKDVRRGPGRPPSGASRDDEYLDRYGRARVPSWRRSPHLQRFPARAWRRQPSRPEPEWSADWVSPATSWSYPTRCFRASRCCVGIRLGPHLPEFAPLHDGSAEVRRMASRSAERFAFALVDVIEFLRSRLPGYPGAPGTRACPPGRLPRLARTASGTCGFRGMAEARRAGLQLPGHAPTGRPACLGVLQTAASDLYDSLR